MSQRRLSSTTSLRRTVEPEALRLRRQRLERDEKAVQDQLQRLQATLHHSGVESKVEVKASLPVWRLEETSFARREETQRYLAQHRRRDRLAFFFCFALLGLALFCVWWLVRTHLYASGV